MKKSLALILALALVLSFSAAAMAAETTPSVEAKPAPVVSAVAAVDASGNEVAVTAAEVVVTPVSKAEDANPEEAEKVTAAYDSIKDTSKPLTELAPNLEDVVKSVDENVDANELVVTDVFGVSVTGEAAAVLENGGSLTLKVETKCAPGDLLIVMQYIDGEWVALDPANVVINNDGTVSITIDTAAPIAFLTKAA